MVLEARRAWADRFLLPAAQVATRRGWSPNAITLVSLGLAVLAGALLWWGQVASAAYLALGGVMVLASAGLDALDGRVARLQGTSSARGDYLDHVTDRYADVAILLGIGLGPLVPLQVTLLAIIGTLLTSYMGTQAQAVGVGRDYKGLLTRADRLVLLGVVPVVQGLVPLPMLPLGLSALAWLLLLIGVLGNVTAVQRFAAAWRELGRPRP